MNLNISIFKEAFSGFVQTHGLVRHFRRFGLSDLVERSESNKELPTALLDKLRDAGISSGDDLLKVLATHRDGLTELQAGAVRAQVGLNEFEQEKKLHWWAHLWLCYKNPFSILLTALATISYFTDDAQGAVVIGAMVALGTVIRFVQETRSNKAAEKLKAMVSNTATVLRRHAADDLLADHARLL